MPRKRSQTSRSSARRRKARQTIKYTWKVTPVQYKELLDLSLSLVEKWLLDQEALEVPVMADLESKAA